MKSSKVLKLLPLFVLLIISCSPKIFPEERVKMRALETSLKSYKSLPIASVEIEVEEHIASERILYKKGNTFGYFEKNRWICSPDCMLERIILKNLKLQNKSEGSVLKLRVIDLYVDFSEGKPKAVLTVRAELKGNSEDNVKIFHFEKTSEASEREVFKTFNEITTEFLEKLAEWIKEETDRFKAPNT